MTKRAVYLEDIPIVNIYSSNNRILKFMKQKLTKLKGEIDKFTSKVRYFDFTHSVIARKK